MNDMERIDFYSRVKFTNLHHQVEECFQDAAFDAITSIIKVPHNSHYSYNYLCLRFQFVIY